MQFSEENVCYRCVKVSVNKKLSYKKGELQAFGFFSQWLCLSWLLANAR